MWDFLHGQSWSQENPEGPLASLPKQGALLLPLLGQPNLGAGRLATWGLPTALGSAYGLSSAHEGEAWEPSLHLLHPQAALCPGRP